MDLRDDLMHMAVGAVRHEGLVPVRREKKHEKTLGHGEQHIGFRRRVELEVCLGVISNVRNKLGRRSPLDHFSSTDDVLQIDVFTMRLPLETSPVSRVLPERLGKEFVAGKVDSFAGRNVTARFEPLEKRLRIDVAEKSGVMRQVVVCIEDHMGKWRVLSDK
jgi:hypothetical protein